MSGMDKYIMDVDHDCETGEEHTTIVRTDKTQNMENWEILVTTMYTHHSIFENVVVELNRLNNENEQLKFENKNLKAILNDFINTLNRLQSNPNNEQTLNVARDMLQNIGKELEE